MKYSTPSINILLFCLLWQTSCSTPPPGSASSTAKPANQRDSVPELMAMAEYVASDAKDLSGIVFVGQKLLAVSDDKADHFIYQLNLGPGKKLKFAPWKNLKKLNGWKRVKENSKRLDLEAIAFCPKNEFYIANERARQIIHIDENQKLNVHSLVDANNSEMWGAGGDNAGPEGLAVDCATKTIFVAKERAPRKLFKVTLNPFSSITLTDLMAPSYASYKTKNPWGSSEQIEVLPDFSDLVFENGYLYALARNTAEIVKFLPGSSTELARFAFNTSSGGCQISALYDTGEPFGLAEALAFKDDEIWLGFDNNGKALSEAGQKCLGSSGNGPLIIVFKRPQGF